MADVNRGGFGGSIPRTREEGGGPRDVLRQAKVSVTALEALERNEIARLPGGIFSRSVVRSSAQEIGVESATRGVAARFAHASILHDVCELSETDCREREVRSPRRFAVVLAVGAGLLAAGALAVRFLR